MPYMKPIAGFEPSDTAKKLLLYLKKNTKNISGAYWPGLFAETHYGFMAISALLALGLDWLGLVFIIDQIDLGAARGVAAIAFMIILDVALVFLSHLKVYALCLYENQQRILSQEDGSMLGMGAKAAEYDKGIFMAKVWRFSVALLIWFIAAAKVGLYYSLEMTESGEIDPTAMFIIASFVLVAIINTNFSGYALFGLFARIAWKSSEKKFISSYRQENQAKIRIEDMLSRAVLIPDTMEDRPLSRGAHTLEKLLSVDLEYRDPEGKARILLAPSLLKRLQESLRKKSEEDFIENRKILMLELPIFKQEIDDLIRQQIATLLTIDINPQTVTGILNPELIHFLRNEEAIASDKIQQLERGGALYRLTATGLLLDDDLEGLANATPDSKGRGEIALHGLNLQLQML